MTINCFVTQRYGPIYLLRAEPASLERPVHKDGNQSEGTWMTATACIISHPTHTMWYIQSLSASSSHIIKEMKKRCFLPKLLSGTLLVYSLRRCQEYTARRRTPSKEFPGDYRYLCLIQMHFFNCHFKKKSLTLCSNPILTCRNN